MFTVRVADRQYVSRQPYELVRFSGGELQIKLDLSEYVHADLISIDAHLTSSDKVMELVLLMDALRRRFTHRLTWRLVCPYLPYGRQDRVCAPGEAFSLKVFAGIINSLNFDVVEVWDAHSDVTGALINNVELVSQVPFVSDIPDLDRYVLLSPDAGSLKKIGAVAKETKRPMVRADKIRDVSNGKILETVIYSEPLGNQPLLIVDDICDGGRTFIELAKVGRTITRGAIDLYVTHGIFSQGLGVFKGLIDHVFTVLPFPGVDTSDPILTVIKTGFTA